MPNDRSKEPEQLPGYGQPPEDLRTRHPSLEGVETRQAGSEEQGPEPRDADEQQDASEHPDKTPVPGP